MNINWSPIWVSPLDVIKIAYIVSVQFKRYVHVVYGDQDYLAFCLPISVELHQIKY